ncbi:stringent starvation protein B [Marinobacterium sp. MBR-111]|jgi:stringent starvation protein B
MSSIKPSRPYLLRALYEWVLDNDMTPHLVVDATIQGVQVPEQFVQDGQITLNIASGAVQGLVIEDHGVGFNARFGGVPMNVYVPMVAVMAIFTRENGMGMGFGVEPGVEELLKQTEDGVQLPPDDEPPEPPKGGRKPALRVVK